MESEKVKEIKKVLEMFAIDNKEMTLFQSPVPQGESCVKTIKYADILTLINELESENERLYERKLELERQLTQRGLTEYIGADEIVNQARKETAREFLKEVKEIIKFLDVEWEISMKLHSIAKQFGVEVEDVQQED